MDDQDFRRRARAFLATHGFVADAKTAAQEGSRDPDVVAAEKALQAKLFDAGFAGLTWPRPHDPRPRHAYAEGAVHPATPSR